jgi:long-subunit fatty acid transport protein
LLEYPADGPQRYALISAQVLQAYAGPTLAHRFAPWLSVGVGFEYSFLSVKQSLAAQVCLASDTSCPSDDPRNDVVLDLDVVDPARFAWNAGILVEPAPAVSIGASVQPAIHFEPEGSMTTTFSPDNGRIVPELTSQSFSDPSVRLVVDLPWIVRAGVQVAPTERTRVEVAGTYSSWGGTPELTITDVDVELTTREDGVLHGQSFSVTDDVVFPTGFQDAWSVRLGGEVDLTKAFTVRAGGCYESSAVPDEYVNVSVVDGPKAGGGLGVSVRKGRFTLDVGGIAEVLFDRELADSSYRQQVLTVDDSNGFATTIATGKVVGNGTLTSVFAAGGVGLSVDLGRGGGAERD